VTLGAGEIAQPEFQLPAFGNDDRGLLTAELAASRTACAAHPAGFLLSGVKQPIDAGKPSWESAARSFILTPQDNAWLNSDELFLVSGVSLIDAAFGAELRRFASLGQQIRDLNNPALWTSNRQRVELHARIVRPVLDLTVALIGIPLVFSRRDRNVFLALGMCLVVVLAIQVLVVVSHGLGASRLIPSSSLAAWLPLFGLLPVGIAAQVQLEV
jgi:lipopolysaccharide export system permease protein